MMNRSVAIVMALTLAGGCQSGDRRAAPPEPVYDVGCSICIFRMPPEDGCRLAIRIEGKPYLVQGSSLDDHGDAHAPDGLCNTVRQAHAAGRIESARFIASRIELLPLSNSEP